MFIQGILMSEFCLKHIKLNRYKDNKYVIISFSNGNK